MSSVRWQRLSFNVGGRTSPKFSLGGALGSIGNGGGGGSGSGSKSSSTANDEGPQSMANLDRKSLEYLNSLTGIKFVALKLLRDGAQVC